jgi:hypothetical protein
MSQAPRGKPGSRARKAPPSLATTSRVAPTSRSALSNTVKVAGRESDDDEIEFIENGYLSEHDETVGEERENAVRSPPKAGKRVTSSVSCFTCLCR